MQKYILILLLFSAKAFAQKDPINNPSEAKDSVIYTHLKAKMEKHRITNEIYHFLFRDVYNQTPSGEVKTIEVNRFLPYKDKVIGKILVKTLDIFGPTVYDTSRKGNQFERFGSHVLHKDTRHDIIKNSFLLFKEGDNLNPKVMEDNERLLRRNPIFHDARILVEVREDIKWLVDVTIIVQDVWSENFDVLFNNLQSYGLSLNETNFQGRGNSFKNYFRYEALDPFQKLQGGSQYTVPNYKNTFMTLQGELLWDRDLHRQAFRAFRPFITTDTKYAGSFEVGHSVTREFKRLIINKIDSLFNYRTSFSYFDFWLGRSFRIPKIDNPNARLIIATRMSGYNYTDRPRVTEDTNKLYWNRRTNLFSLGYSNRNYRRDLLIYGFGRTEDVPIGSLFSLTGGWENTEFGKRGYGGVQYAKGYYLPNNNGYFYGIFNFGSFLKNGILQQGVVGGEGNYISPLLRFKKHHFRHFITLKYTFGIDRDAVDYLNISNREGITGVNSDYLRGDKRLTLNIESVMFSPKTIVGFRVASYIFCSLGLVNLQGRPLLNSPVYQGYGIGFRLRNENLTFNTFQVRFGYYPNIPFLNPAYRYGLEGVQPLKLRDFDITAPSIVTFR